MSDRATRRSALRIASRTRKELNLELNVGEQQVDLSSKERLIVNNLLPIQGNLIMMRNVQKLRDALLFPDDEANELGIEITEQEDGSTHFKWGPDEGNTEVSITFSSKMFAYIGSTLQSLDKDSKLEVGHVSLWSKFVPKNEEE